LLDPNNRLQSVKAPPSASATLEREKDMSLALLQPPPLPKSLLPQTPRVNSPRPAPVRSTETELERRPTLVQQPKPVPATQLLSPVPHHATMMDANSSALLNKALPIKAPLKSALRNPSRTPSPNPLTLARSPALVPSPPVKPSPPPIITSPIPSFTKSDDDDASFVTVHETWEAESDDEVPPSPPAHDPHPVNGVGESDISSSTAAASAGDTEGVPARRKSVRMSLPPTFSTTPPALEDWEGEKEKFPWASRIPEPDRRANPERNIWEDSSDEDEEYSMARKLLSRVAGKGRH
jgi:hypothetical protein